MPPLVNFFCFATFTNLFLHMMQPSDGTEFVLVASLGVGAFAAVWNWFMDP